MDAKATVPLALGIVLARVAALGNCQPQDCEIKCYPRSVLSNDEDRCLCAEEMRKGLIDGSEIFDCEAFCYPHLPIQWVIDGDCHCSMLDVFDDMDD